MFVLRLLCVIVFNINFLLKMTALNNDIYKMQIRNAQSYLKTLDVEKLSSDDINAFQISEVLAICWCINKEQVIIDILTFEK